MSKAKQLVSMPPREHPIAVVDIETTGYSHRTCSIISIAVIRASYNHAEGKYEAERTFSALVAAPQSALDAMHWKAVETNGYNAAAWADAPPFNKHVVDIYDALDGAVFVAHNAAFDLSFINTELDRAGCVPPDIRGVACTAQLSRQMIPSLPNAKLATLRGYLGLSSEGAHEARKDADDALAVFNHLAALARPAVAPTPPVPKRAKPPKSRGADYYLCELRALPKDTSASMAKEAATIISLVGDLQSHDAAKDDGDLAFEIMTVLGKLEELQAEIEKVDDETDLLRTLLEEASAEIEAWENADAED